MRTRRKATAKDLPMQIARPAVLKDQDRIDDDGSGGIMGTWGTGPFDNDGAGDWLETWKESGAALPDYVRATLTEVLDNHEYLEVDDGQYAVAAAAVTARQL